MKGSANYEVHVISGRKAGSSQPIPISGLSVGTTLDSQFFIGCVDMWHHLLKADASADLRSASASRDALPEQLMLVELFYTDVGMSLTVNDGFAESAGRRVLPGETVSLLPTEKFQVGASELELRLLDSPQQNFQVTLGSNLPVQQPSQKPRQAHFDWLSNKAAMSSITVLAVVLLSASAFLKPNNPVMDESRSFVGEDKPELVVASDNPGDAARVVTSGLSQAASVRPKPFYSNHDGQIENQAIVAVINSSPQFIMTDSGERYEVGAVLSDGYKLVRITADLVEFRRGSEIGRFYF